jgi:hypothetical protein
MRMKAINRIERGGGDIILPDEEFEAASPKEAVFLEKVGAAVLIEDKKIEDPKDPTAKELIEKIKTMTVIGEVAALFTGETRTTVKDALKARIKELKAAEKK